MYKLYELTVVRGGGTGQADQAATEPIIISKSKN